MQSKQYNEVQKRIDNLALTVIELIRTVEAMKTVMDNRKSTCNCSKSVNKDADGAQESCDNCKIESRRDVLNRELSEMFERKTCGTCWYNMSTPYCYACMHCVRQSQWVAR